ncbi:MAG: hypothetical protein U0326_28525 [Polyangiales bacterium]
MADAIFGARREHLRERVVERARHALDPRRGRAEPVGAEPFEELCGSFEGRGAHDGLVEHAPERVEVCAGVGLVAFEELGREVPQRASVGARVATRSSTPNCDARPKSTSTTRPSSESITFSGLRSRCTTPLACTTSSAAQIGWNTVATSASCAAVSAPPPRASRHRSTRARSDSPTMSSIAYQGPNSASTP